jgi:hypothetical protein
MTSTLLLENPDITTYPFVKHKFTSVFSGLMLLNLCNTSSATTGTGPVYTSGAHEFYVDVVPFLLVIVCPSIYYFLVTPLVSYIYYFLVTPLVSYIYYFLVTPLVSYIYYFLVTPLVSYIYYFLERK